LDHGWQLVENTRMFRDISRSDTKEEDEVFQIIDRMHKYVIGTKAFSVGFFAASGRGWLLLAKYFIDEGADIEYKGTGSTTVLYGVVRHFSSRNVKIIEFLLQQGANPYPKNSKGYSIEGLGGMRKVEKYFGKTWKELVAELQGEKASTTGEPSEPSQH
jgi:hypothetical protein